MSNQPTETVLRALAVIQWDARFFELPVATQKDLVTRVMATAEAYAQSTRESVIQWGQDAYWDRKFEEFDSSYLNNSIDHVIAANARIEALKTIGEAIQ